MLSVSAKDFFDFSSKYTTAAPPLQQQQQLPQLPGPDTVFPLGRTAAPFHVRKGRFGKVAYVAIL
jgi:hypothetical protein